VGCILILLGLVEAAGVVGRVLRLEVAVVAVTALVLALLLPWRSWVSYLALSCALFGGVIGVLSVTQAFAAVGNNAEYGARIPLAAAALVLALVAGSAGIVARYYMARVTALMVLAGLTGAVAINLHSINTAYDFAVPSWLLSALLYVAEGLRSGLPAKPARQS
jgi:hypothetical protein